MKEILLVGIGGAAGSVLRYLTSVIITRYVHTLFPLATFAVNILGCLLAGVLIGIFTNHLDLNPNLKFLLLTGFCGGFTTFSTFSAEGYELFHSGNTSVALVYLLVSIVMGLGAVWAGIWIGSQR